jgi:S-formylglutathione hydrolase
VALPGTLLGQGTLATDSVESPGLAANVVGASSSRPVVIYLPPSYQTDRARRYPVLYMLHGATSVPEEWLDGSYQGLNLRTALDSLIDAGALPELIVVIPNSDIELGSHWYANSPALGNWEDFIVRDVVGHVDRRYRTDARRESRALFGHSMGGFGSLVIGFKHPDRFGFVYASSPARMAFTGAIAPDAKSWAELSRLTRWQDASGELRLVVGMAAALDGSRTDPRLFDELPYGPGPDGAPVAHAKAQARWRSGMPLELASGMVRRGDRRPELLVDAGSEEAAILEARGLLRGRLDSLGIRYGDTTFAGGHVDRVRERITQHMLPALGRWLAGSAVEALVRQYDSAWNRRDTSAVGRLLAPAYQYFSSRGEVSSRAETMAFLRSPEYRLEHAERSEIAVALSGPVAVVSSRWRGRGTYRREAFRDDQRCGQSWVRSGRTWQLVSEHCVQIAPAAPAN